MKKFKIIFATVMLGIATVGGFQAYEYVNMSTGSVLLENVEALASVSEDDDKKFKINCKTVELGTCMYRCSCGTLYEVDSKIKQYESHEGDCSYCPK